MGIKTLFKLVLNVWWQRLNWVSAWVSNSEAKWAVFPAISWREQVTFRWDVDDVCFLQDQQT